MQTLFLTLLLISITSFPLFCWKKSRSLALPACGFFLLFLYLWFDFFTGARTPTHDTYFSYKVWYSVINNWAQQGVFPLWNPYLGGGQPVALYNNILPSAVVHIFAFLFSSIGLKLSNDQFFGFVWTFNFFSICSGTLLLSTLLFSHSFARLLPFVTLLFSSLFKRDLIEPVGYITLSYLPYILFFLLLFLKERSPHALLLLALVGGLCCNIYLPTYVGITLLLFTLIALLYALETNQYARYSISSFIHFFRSHERMNYVAMLCFLLAVAPMLYNFVEIHHYVSPTRGYTEAGEIQGHHTGSQAAVTAPLSVYRGLIDGRAVLSMPTDTHSIFSLGILPGILFFFALFFPKRGLFLIFSLTAFLLIPIGMGPEIPLWNFLMDHIPFFNMMRHSFLFARIISFLFLMASAFGVYALLSPHYSLKRKVIALLLSTLIVIPFVAHTVAGWIIPLFDLLLLFFLIQLSQKEHDKKKDKLTFLIVSALFALHIMNLQLSVIEENKLVKPDSDTLELAQTAAYQGEWTSRTGGCNLAFNFKPVINRTIAWTDERADCMFMLQRDFANFVRAFGLESRKAISKNLFYLLPVLTDISDDHLASLYYEPLFMMPKYYLHMKGIPNAEQLFAEREQFLTMINRVGIKSVQIEPNPSPNILTVQTNTLIPRKLLRLENYHHGWSASIDGKPVPIQRVYPSFQMIDIPPGKHTITFDFDSPYHYLTLLQYVSMIIGWFLFLFFLWSGRLESDEEKKKAALL